MSELRYHMSIENRNLCQFALMHIRNVTTSAANSNVAIINEQTVWETPGVFVLYGIDLFS